MKKSVAILMGSSSDSDTFQDAVLVLEKFGVPHEVHVLSAHRSPHALHSYVEGAREKGIAVFIAGAGGAAHLAGAVAALTTLPVLGVPVESVLLGLDSLLSTVQMPAGIPVGTLGIGRAGAQNAALLAVEILALSDPALAVLLEKHKEDLARQVAEKDRTLQGKAARLRKASMK